MIRFLAALFFLAAPAFGDPSLVWDVRPGVAVPLGDAQSWAGTSAGLENGVEWTVPGTRWNLTGTVRADWIPLNTSGTILLFSAYPGVGYAFPGVFPGCNLVLTGQAGVTFGTRSSFNESVVEPFLAVGNTFRFQLEPTLAFDAAVRFEFIPGLWQGVGFWAGFSQAVGG